MTVNSSRFNRFLLILLTQNMLCAPLYGQLPTLSDDQLHWLGEQIFNNECNSRPACLTSWNEGEDFPSLGIGHFIWYPRENPGPFEETFPALIDYLDLVSLEQGGTEVPDWLLNAVATGAPWPDRNSFHAEIDSSKMGQLRRFLLDTRNLQAEYIVARLYDQLPEMLAAFPRAEQPVISARFERIATSQPPYGLYALIDYVHFKGTGLHSGERYQNQGWGLVQVLAAMPETNADGTALSAFVSAAEEVLRRRVANAPPDRNEARWLPGWLNRLQTYLPSEGSASF